MPRSSSPRSVLWYVCFVQLGVRCTFMVYARSAAQARSLVLSVYLGSVVCSVRRATPAEVVAYCA